MIETAASFREDFLDQDDFSVLAVLSRSGRFSQEVLGIFNREPVELLQGYEAPVRGFASSFMMSKADADQVEQGDQLHVEGRDYVVEDIDDNGSIGGAVRLILGGVDG